MSFFPIDEGIFTSSVWLQGSAEEKVVWMWLLGHRDDEGVVRHRDFAIAYGTCLKRKVVDAALKKFSEPDDESRTREHEGRRIARTAEGFVKILNHELYYSKDYSTPRWRRWKERQGLKPKKSVGKRVGRVGKQVGALANTVGNDVHVHLQVQEQGSVGGVVPDLGSMDDGGERSLCPVPSEAGRVEADVIANETDAVRNVFDYWRRKTGHERSGWTEERKRRLLIRLREEPGNLAQKVAGLKLAVDGALVDPVHSGAEKGRAYLGFENLFIHQGRDRIEKLQAAALGADAPRPGAHRRDELEEGNAAAVIEAISRVRSKQGLLQGGK